MLKSDLSQCSKSMHDLRYIGLEEVEYGQKNSKRTGIKLSDIWKKIPLKKTDNKSESKPQNIMKKDQVNNCYVTNFVREKGNNGKKEKRNAEKVQKAQICEAKALEKEAEEICREILEIVKANSPSLGRIERPVSILKKKAKDQPRVSRPRVARPEYEEGLSYATHRLYPVMPGYHGYEEMQPSLQVWQDPQTGYHTRGHNCWLHVF